VTESTETVELYRAKRSFATVVGEDTVVVTAGEILRKGHSLIEGREHLFEPLEGHIRPEIEQATKAPGEKRGGKRTPAKAKAEGKQQKTGEKKSEE